MSFNSHKLKRMMPIKNLWPYLTNNLLPMETDCSPRYHITSTNVFSPALNQFAYAKTESSAKLAMTSIKLREKHIPLR